MGQGSSPKSKALVGRVAAIVLLAFSLGLSALVNASADELDDRSDEALKQWSAAKDDLAKATQDLATAQDELAVARDELSIAQAELNVANANLRIAQSEDNRLAAELQIAEDELALAQLAVENGERDLARQHDRMVLSVQSMTQQDPVLLTVGIFLANLGTADINNQLQWASEIFSSTQAEFDELKRIQTRLTADQKRAATAEQIVRTKREEAAAAYEITQTAQQKAQDATDLFAALVIAAQSKEEAASDWLRISQEQADAAEQYWNEIQAEIAQSNGGEDRPASSDSFFFVPLEYYSISSPFGWRWHPIYQDYRHHDGVDMAASCGTPIRAAESGKVIRAQYHWSYGNNIVIDHGSINGNGYTTLYAHQSAFAVSVGEYVYRGQVIGYVGSTGDSTGCHLHWEVYENGGLRNPNDYASL